MPKDINQFVLPTRFRLIKQQLKNLEVHTLESNWIQAAQDLAEKISGERRAKTNLFNQAILALSPVLVHGFKKTGGTLQNPVYEMLALDQYPNEALVRSLAHDWAEIWLKSTFEDAQIGIFAQGLYDLIVSSNRKWVNKSALDALQNNNGITYGAIPSLIAAYFVTLGDSNIDDRVIKWGLAQQSNGRLAVLSEPLPSEEGGTFSYLIDFSLQYQPGNSEPWIYTSLTCQRYMDEPLLYAKDKGNVNILLRSGKPLNAQWAYNETQVRLSVWNPPIKSDKNRKPKFPTGLLELLQRAKARPIESDAQVILGEPLRFRHTQDRYLVVFSEGYKPDHALGQGFSARERTQIFCDLSEKLADILVPGKAIPIFRKGLEPVALAPWKLTEKKQKRSIDKKRELRLNALRAATGNRPIRILLASSDESTNEAMRYILVKRHLLTDDAAQLPDDIEVKSVLIPPALFVPLNPDASTKTKDKEKRLDAEQKASKEWASFFREYVGPRGTYTLAWTELPPSTPFRSVHDAIRMAGVKESVGTQMITRVKYADFIQEMGRYNLVAGGDFGRLFHACGDLILRQLGVTSEITPLRDEYVRAGYPPEIAKDLVVIGITAMRNNADYKRGRGPTYIPLAVRVLANGRVEAKIPDVCDWTYYLDASILLGETFIKHQRSTPFKVSNEQALNFISRVVSDHQSAESLLLLDAYMLRAFWKYLKVGDLQAGTLKIGNNEYTPSLLPKMDVLWIRQKADSETPQYVSTNETAWDTAEDADRIAHASIFIDTDSESQLPIFFSVGRLDNNNKSKQDAMRHQEGATMNFRNQQLVEMAPIMGRFPEAALATAHLLRSMPWWSTGDTIMPYPIHMAETLQKDMRPLMGVEDNPEED